MDVFVARQPIFDKHRKIHAYELLFRTGKTNGFPDIDGDTATSSLLSSSFFTVGIDKIGAGKKVFINFTEDLIKKGTPLLFPSEQLMVEILENVTPSDDIVAACRELKEAGYELALDDFVYSKNWDDLIEISDIIKVDFRLTPMEEIEKMLLYLEPYDCRLLAEKVETYEEFERALELGFELFQGYFFSKPETLQNKDLSATQMAMLHLIAEVNSAEFDIDALEELVEQDVSISYKLLNFINSSHFSRIQPIASIRQAISYLGEREFKQFVTLIATSKLTDKKPNELVRASIIRARFLELISEETKQNKGELFLLGLFSYIDAMLDQKIETLVGKMSLSENISTALAERNGQLFPFIRLIESYEKSNWVGFKYCQKKVGVSDDKIIAAYLEAIEWANSFQE